MILKLRVAYPSQTDEIDVEPDDLPRGAVIAGEFIGVDFHPERAVLALSSGPLEVPRGQSREFDSGGVAVTASFP